MSCSKSTDEIAKFNTIPLALRPAAFYVGRERASKVAGCLYSSCAEKLGIGTVQRQSTCAQGSPRQLAGARWQPQRFLRRSQRSQPSFQLYHSGLPALGSNAVQTDSACLWAGCYSTRTRHSHQLLHVRAEINNPQASCHVRGPLNGPRNSWCNPCCVALRGRQENL